MPYLKSIPICVRHYSLFTEAGFKYEAWYVYAFPGTPASNTTPHLVTFHPVPFHYWCRSSHSYCTWKSTS